MNSRAAEVEVVPFKPVEEKHPSLTRDLTVPLVKANKKKTKINTDRKFVFQDKKNKNKSVTKRLSQFKALKRK